MRLVAICGLALFLATSSEAKEALRSKRDKVLQGTWFTPSRIPLPPGKIKWRYCVIYPSIFQSFDGAKKELVLNILISNVVMTSPGIAVSLDGKVAEIEGANWTQMQGSAFVPVVSAQTALKSQEAIIRQIASAKSVVVGVNRPGAGHDFTLSDKQIAIFRDMIIRYDALDPK